MEQKEVRVLHFRSKLGSVRPSLLATEGRRQGEGEGPAAGSVTAAQRCRRTLGFSRVTGSGLQGQAPTSLQVYYSERPKQAAKRSRFPSKY